MRSNFAPVSFATVSGTDYIAKNEIEVIYFVGSVKLGLEDLVVAAINDAVRKIAARSQEKYAGLMSGLNLPPGVKLPF